MTVPPNTLAAISIGITAWLSTKYSIKAPFIISSIFIAIVGELMDSPPLTYARKLKSERVYHSHRDAHS